MDDLLRHNKRFRTLAMAGICGIVALSQTALLHETRAQQPQRPMRLPATKMSTTKRTIVPQHVVSATSGVPFPKAQDGIRAKTAAELQAENAVRLRSLARSQGLWSQPPLTAQATTVTNRTNSQPDGAHGLMLTADPEAANSFSLPSLAVQNLRPPMTSTGSQTLDSPPRSKARVVRVASPSLTGHLQSAQLAKIANESLQKAGQALRKRSIYTAQQSALQAIHSVVSARDADSGSNVHSHRLEAALDAIREANDFCGPFGVVDNDAVKRMVDSHSTTILQGQDLTNVAAIKAVEAYLTIAKNNLVASAGSSIEASESFRLMGRIQNTLEGESSIYDKAVALTWLQAAVESRPGNAVAHRDLGQTLLSQGLPEEASSSLRQSIRLMPTRGAVQQLLVASQQMGDTRSTQLCQATLQSDQLPSDFSIARLTPEQFAMTGQKPASRSANRVATRPANPSSAKAASSATRDDRRSEKNWYQFWRR